MTRTVFKTPVLTPALRLLANGWLKLSGWRVVAPSIAKPPFVFIGAPHTSNWDFFLLMAGVLHLGLDVRWLGKHTLFPPGLGLVMRWMGGIPVNRTRAHNTVAKMAALFETFPQTILCIPPEGTRSKVNQWKTGFYRIAEQASVPILLAAIDAENKELRLLGEFRPGGDMEADMALIQARYRGLKGLRPHNTAEQD